MPNAADIFCGGRDELKESHVWAQRKGQAWRLWPAGVGGAQGDVPGSTPGSLARPFRLVADRQSPSSSLQPRGPGLAWP